MNDRIEDQAWQWHCALQGDDADWDGFTAWLEADPAHRTAYDEVALLDDALDEQRARLDVIVPSDDDTSAAGKGRRWALWAGGAVAAALALFVAVPMLEPGNVAPQDYRTAVSQTREIALDDGSRITLGPSSHLTVAGSLQDKIALEGGAWFDIRHDPDRKLTVTASGRQITDIGTQFDVVAVPGYLHVAVAEGQVAVQSADQDTKPIQLSAGRSLSIDAKASAATVRQVEPQDIGSWRAGRLVYNDAPLLLVAADISRYVGRQIIVSPDLASRRFSGVLAAEDGAKLVDELDDLMGLEAQVEGDHLRLVAGGR